MGIHDKMNGIGAHEVIIETPRHELAMADMTVEEISRVIWMYRERLQDLIRDRRFKYVLIFKNSGAAAGASLSHPHSQLIATPVTPLTMAGELISAKEHYQEKERCLFCDVINQELDSGERVVLSTDQMVAVTPFASRFPFEIFLAPRHHQHSFAEISDSMIREVAIALKEVLMRLRKCLNDPAYNFLIHTVPNTKAKPTAHQLLGHDRSGFPLAYRTDAAPDRHRGFRVGVGVLHQSDRARGGCQVFAGGGTVGAPASISGKRRDPRNCLPDNQRVYVVGPLICDHRFQVAHMADNRELEADAVCAQHLPRHPGRLKGDRHVVPLGHRSLRRNGAFPHPSVGPAVGPEAALS